MSPANIVTILRILLIPVFAVFAIRYGASIKAGEPQEILRWLSLSAFIIAAAGDWLDGYLARKHGKTKLGAFLDPLCDKVLMLVGLIVLSQVSWSSQGWTIPEWYVVMVVARDVSIATGCVFILLTGKKLEVNTNWSGKATTFVQLFTLGWVMLKVVPFSPLIPTVVAAIFTLWSSWYYVREALRQLQPE
ncbi:MAG: CDP-diacylglycerol--glycerol-3-phosphate 3-phosphatidyltransferase [Rubritalea sp.]|jgi:cardiolipin synthase|tara:strand:- start:14651 stop:15220 length:570 start_codon:yes stop_codon:yes gene_type:complete